MGLGEVVGRQPYSQLFFGEANSGLEPCNHSFWWNALAIEPRLYFFHNLETLMYLIFSRCLCVREYNMTSALSLNRLLQKDSNTESLRYHWLTFRMMRSMLTGRSDWELKMFKGGMFWQISGYVEFLVSSASNIVDAMILMKNQSLLLCSYFIKQECF